MVALFVIATILVCVGIELIRERAAKRHVVPAPVKAIERILIPKGYFLSKAHLWVEMLFTGEARIGVDDFTQKVVGSIDRIEVVPAGSEVKKGEPLFTLRSGKRSLSMPAPISGKVTNVNDSLLAAPKTLQSDPYVSGWVAVLAPKSIAAELRLLSIAEDAAKWMRKEIARFRDFIRLQMQNVTPATAGITLLDGGMPLEGVLNQFNEKTWASFQKEFLKAE